MGRRASDAFWHSFDHLRKFPDIYLVVTFKKVWKCVKIKLQEAKKNDENHMEISIELDFDGVTVNQEILDMTQEHCMNMLDPSLESSAV